MPAAAKSFLIGAFDASVHGSTNKTASEAAVLSSCFILRTILMSFKNLCSFLFLSLIRMYQICLSPLFPPCCRFYPTCSNYALEAVRKYGVCRGSFLTIRRILRCNPYCKGGYDPVP